MSTELATSAGAGAGHNTATNVTGSSAGISYPRHIRRLVESFSSLLQTDRTVPLRSDVEYMRLTELRFLVKNVRELSAIQLYQSYSKCDTITATQLLGSADIPLPPSDPAEVKCTSSDAAGIDIKVRELDLFLTELCVLVNTRLNVARQAQSSGTIT
jgi:hypothetical protein